MYTGSSGLPIVGKPGVYDTPSGYAYGSKIYGEDPNTYGTFDPSRNQWVNVLYQTPSPDYYSYFNAYQTYTQQQRAQQEAQQQQQQYQQQLANAAAQGIQNQQSSISNILAGQANKLTKALTSQPPLQDILLTSPYVPQQSSYASQPPYQKGFYQPDAFSYYPYGYQQSSSLPSSYNGGLSGDSAASSFGGSASGGVGGAGAGGAASLGGGGFGSLN